MSAMIGHEPTCRFCGLTLREHFGAGSRAGGHPFGAEINSADHDDPRRASDTDAAMLADLREWWKRQDLRTFDDKDIRLTREEFALLLAIADERDDLKLECEEETAPAYPPLSAKITQPMPVVDIAIGNEVEDAPTVNDLYDFHVRGSMRDLYVTTPTAPSSTSEVQAAQLLDGTPCEHKTGTPEGGAIVCAECGLLIAWIRFDFETKA